MIRSLFIFFLFPTSLFAQFDFNKDGSVDFMDFNNLEYRDGASGEYFMLGRHHNFSDFLDFIPIPLGMENHPELVDSLEHSLLGSTEKAEVSPAEKWLLDAYAFQEIPRSHPVYSKIIRAPLNWVEWPPEFPKVIYQRVSKGSHNLPQLNEEELEFNEGWLIYYGHNHRQFKNNQAVLEFEEVISTREYVLFKTSHGLIMRKGNQYAWIFHSNGSLTGGPPKLRWPSISDISTYKDLVILEHQSAVLGIHKVFIIVISNGTVVELILNEDIAFSDDNLQIRVENEKLRISNSDVIKLVDLDDLMDTFSQK